MGLVFELLLNCETLFRNSKVYSRAISAPVELLYPGLNCLN